MPAAQSTYGLFTRFENHGTINPSDVELELHGLQVKYFIFQEECCPDTLRRHLQGYVWFNKRYTATGMSRLFPAHWELRRGSHLDAKKYCSKEETRVPLTHPRTCGQEPPSRVGAREDLAAFRDAIRDGLSETALLDAYPREMAKFPRFKQQVRREKIKQAILDGRAEFVPRTGWQTNLHFQLAEEPDPRQVIWRWELTGNVGKSFFASNYSPERTFLVTGGKHADIIYGYQFEPVVIFDWPRSQLDTFPYGLVEQFKNGYFYSGKYESESKRFPTPHVVVFANFPPDQSKMSGDRWDIWELGYPQFVRVLQ